MPNLISLTTDYGMQDGYVGALKGAILSIAERAQLVDITHELAPQDVVGAAFVLASATPYFPVGAVHLAIVDPGVGSGRRMLAARTARAHYVAPDNGLLTLAFRREPPLEIAALTERRYWRAGEISRTFHGRDIMGPVAAHISNGVPLGALGAAVTDPVQLALAQVEVMPNGQLMGQIVYVDRFGNLISNIPAAQLPERALIQIGDLVLHGIRQAYWEVRPQEPLALVGSHGYLEIAVREGHAQAALKAGRGAQVAVTPQH